MIKLPKLGNKIVANPAKSTAISPGLKFLLPKLVRHREQPPENIRPNYDFLLLFLPGFSSLFKV
jgi:hypothetical protein